MKLKSVVGLAMCLAACGGTRDGEESGETADALSEAATPRKGSTIQSPSVSPAKDYWGARSIEMLVKVGYLKPDEAQLAKRADGIIANSPPNGALGVDELAALESPAHVHTLFPAERAMLPKLWAQILGIRDGALDTLRDLSWRKGTVVIC